MDGPVDKARNLIPDPNDSEGTESIGIVIGAGLDGKHAIYRSNGLNYIPTPRRSHSLD
jgi:hypothetical protein